MPKEQKEHFGQSGEEGDIILECDDDTDCSKGEQCCAGHDWVGTGPLMHTCSKERCKDAIACLPSRGCPAGLHCQVSKDGFGYCIPTPGVQCGPMRCEGTTPVCCWNSATGKGTCISDPTGSDAACSGEDEERLHCRGRSDCGGYDCCHNMLGSTSCSSTCPGPSLGVACLTFADCPSEGPGPGGMRQRYDRCEEGWCRGDLCNATGEWEACDDM